MSDLQEAEMKTGILTFVHTINYGALLQAYAMQALLEKNGIDSEFIDYICPSVRRQHDPKMLWSKLKLKNKILFPFLYCIYSKTQKKFAEFEKEYLRFSDVQYNRENISLTIDNYDSFLVGSDQVWNTDITGGDMTYFLDFIPDKNKKLTYAASMGTADFPEQYRGKCYELVRDFAFVNVREKAGRQALISNGISAECVLDPTLMLDKEQWLQFVGERPHKNKYIFKYMPPSDAEVIRKIRAYARKNGYEVFQAKRGIKPIRGFKTITALSPTEFLTWLYHAELVISGSFHGVCFSVLFEKPFWAVSFNNNNKLMGRIDNILCELGLTERKYRNDIDFTDKKIDFAAANKKLNELKNASMEILKRTMQVR